MKNSQFSKLMEPSYIGSVKTRNRIIKTGAATHYWKDTDIHMNQTTLAFYEAIARGGVGLLVLEAPTVDYPMGGRRFRADDDKFIVGLKELVDTTHKYGCPTFMQMNHNGPWQISAADFQNGLRPVAASPVMFKAEMDMHNQIPRELSIAEIEEIVDKFASAAVRARKAGFDGVDINAGSTHLLHNFLSPFWNKRTDIYGGSTENRARFATSVIREIKKQAGKDFPVAILINGIEISQAIGVDNSKSITLKESLKIAPLLQDAGADAIQIRSTWLGYHVAGFLPDLLFFPEAPVPLKSFPKEYYRQKRGVDANIYLTEAMKKVVTIPITIVGKVRPESGEKILRENKADFIGMTRPLFADPELPNKIAEGKPFYIAPCTSCNTCLDAWSINRRCRINAAMGTDKYTIDKSPVKKKVAVIGGGPAGMETARVAAERGHDVVLFEKSSRLGGLLPLAAFVKGVEIENIPDIIKYYKRQLTDLGVKIELGKHVDASLIDQIKPDVVIVAAGGTISNLDIPGINKRNVLSPIQLHRTAKFLLNWISPGILRWLTNIWMPISKNVVIIGGGVQGAELAEFMIKRGKKVTVIETSDKLGNGMPERMKPYLLSWLRKKGAIIISDASIKEISDEGLIITKEGKPQIIPADTFIPAVPLKSNTTLFNQLQGKAKEIYLIGDSSNPRLMVDAIADGWTIANKI
jgi:2,4-dienoyl-CoA reductase (NADPH2)